MSPTSRVNYQACSMVVFTDNEFPFYYYKTRAKRACVCELSTKNESQDATTTIFRVSRPHSMTSYTYRR
jgi:hypothetical protein